MLISTIQSTLLKIYLKTLIDLLNNNSNKKKSQVIKITHICNIVILHDNFKYDKTKRKLNQII